MNSLSAKIESFLRELKVDTTIERHITVIEMWEPIITNLNLISGKYYELKKSEHNFTVKRVK